MMRMPGPGGAVVVMGGRMTRMLGPGGAVVVMGGRMTRMLGLGLPVGSGGMRGVGRSLLFRLSWGRMRPFFVLLVWVGLEVAGPGGASGLKIGCVACWPGSLSGGSAGVCIFAFAWLSMMSASWRTVSWGSDGHGSAGGAVVEGVVKVVVPHGLGLHDPGLRGFRCVWAVRGALSPVECCVEGFSGGAFAAFERGGLEESVPALWGVFGVSISGV